MANIQQDIIPTIPTNVRNSDVSFECDLFP
jgi:hypothetical protein